MSTGGAADGNGEGVLAGLDVLVVDDDQDTALMLVTLLRLCGATVRSAGSGREAWPLITAWSPHVVLSDLAMPEGDGYEFIERVRGLPGPQAAIPAIAITARGDLQACQRAMAAGFSSVLVKPIDMFGLVVALSGMRPNGGPPPDLAP